MKKKKKEKKFDKRGADYRRAEEFLKSGKYVTGGMMCNNERVRLHGQKDFLKIDHELLHQVQDALAEEEIEIYSTTLLRLLQRQAHSHKDGHNFICEDLDGYATQWDGQYTHIDKVANLVHVKGGEEIQKLFRLCFRNWLVRMIYQAYVWRVQYSDRDIHAANPFVFVLRCDDVSAGNAFFEKLLPAEWHMFYKDKVNPFEKRITEEFTIAYNILLNISPEWFTSEKHAALLRKELNTDKIHNHTILDNFPYEPLYRTASFCAVTDKKLTSDTVCDWRFWGFDVERIDDPATIEYDHEQLLGEVMQYVKENNPTKYTLGSIDSPEQMLLFKHTKSITEYSIVEKLLLSRYRPPVKPNEGSLLREEVIRTTLYNDYCSLFPHKEKEAWKASFLSDRVFRGFGFDLKRKQYGDTNFWSTSVYAVPLSDEECGTAWNKFGLYRNKAE